MQSEVPIIASSWKLWAGRIMSAVAVLFLLLDGITKAVRLPFSVQATTQLGYPERAVVGIAIIELACLVIYLIPRTAVLGAILLTGYLGGAVASQLRAGNPLFSFVLFPIYVALLIWSGIFLRNGRLSRLIPVDLGNSRRTHE